MAAALLVAAVAAGLLLVGQAHREELVEAQPADVGSRLQELIDDPEIGLSNAFLMEVLSYIRQLEAERDKD